MQVRSLDQEDPLEKEMTNLLQHSCLGNPTDRGAWRLPSICCCSAAQACLTLFDPMNRSTPGSPVRHQLLELAQTHVH